MSHTDIFPAAVCEVIDFIEHGDMLQKPFPASTNANKTMVDYGSQSHGLFANLEEALLFYQDEDVEPPCYFLLDITADASGDIPPASDEQERAIVRALIHYEEEHNFYEMINQRIKHLSGELQLQSATVSYLADIISGDLFQIAKARLLCKEPHPYFEAMFEIYKNQGLPVGWSGGESASEGQFIIYSRPSTAGTSGSTAG